MSSSKSKSPKKIAEETNPDFQLTCIGNYSFIKTLGEGNFAKVKLAKHKMTAQEVAVKIIDKTQLDEKKLHKLYREVRIMKSLHHPHIVRLYEVIETRSTVFLVMEYSSGGELYDYLVVHGRMKEKEARAKFRQILSAVSYCHKKRVIHRDLKAENLLLDTNLDIKIADFGFSNQYDPDGKLDTFCGSPPYAAPELFQGRRYVGPEVDIWSLGVILYVLTTGCLPFDGKNLQEMRESVCRGKYRIPFYLSDACEKLLRKFLIKDPSKRASLDIIADDPWLNEGYSEPPICTDLSMKITEDENLIKLIEQKFHMSREIILKSLRENLYDDISALYYLMYHERDRTGDYSRVNQVLNEANVIQSSTLNRDSSTLPRISPDSKSQTTTVVHTTLESDSTNATTTTSSSSSSYSSSSSSKPMEPHASSMATPTTTSAGGSSLLPKDPMPNLPSPSHTINRTSLTPQRISSTAPRRRRFTMGSDHPNPDKPMEYHPPSDPSNKSNGTPPTHLDLLSFTSKTNPRFDVATAPRPITSATPTTGTTSMMTSHSNAHSSSTSTSSTSQSRAVTEVSASVVSSTHSSALSNSINTRSGPHTSNLVPASMATDDTDGIRKRNNTIVGILRNTISRSKPSESPDSSTLPSPMASPIEEGKPRSLRFTFNSNTTSTKPPDDMVQLVLQGCVKNHIQHKLSARYLIECMYTVPTLKDTVRFEVEICKLPRLRNLHGLRFKRVSGASNDYKQICEQLLQSISL